MCGIFALLNNARTYNSKLVTDAFLLGKSRGPENSTLKQVGEKITLGFHRLAINGLDSISNQPITIDNITLICNGEIYNYKELFSLINVTPKTNSDCEIIIHLYKLYGIEYTLQLLDGVYAFVLYDTTSSNEEDGSLVHIARDPLGVRPLYMLSASGKNIKEDDIQDNMQVIYENIIGFASELKVLHELLENNDLSYYDTHRPDSLSHLSKNKIISDKFLMNIEQFIPGTYSTYKKGYGINSSWEQVTNQEKYWQLNATADLTKKLFPEETLSKEEEEVWNALDNAVYKRVVGTTDRPVACLLSGGLDSSLITALVNKHYAGELETYSIGMAGSPDLEFAKVVAKHLGTKHTEVLLSEDDFWNAIPEVIYAIESYDTTSVRASVGNYLIGKYITENSDAKVIFNGDGSDELTGGYLYFLKTPDSIEFDKECKRLLRNIHAFDVLRSDKCISSHGLEPRTPFLDKTFVQKYLSLPATLRNPRSHISSCGQLKPEKYLLRRMAEKMAPGLLPLSVLWRTKEAFSDGVSSSTLSWYEIIQNRVGTLNYDASNYYQGDINKPETNEQIYYRELFNKYYPLSGNIVPYFWMPKYVEATDSSARTLNVYKEQIKE